MEQLASNRGVWVRVVIALITATFVSVVGAGAAFARVAAGETDPEVAATVENTGDEAAQVVEVARDDGAAEVERAMVAPPDVGGAVKDSKDKVGGTVKDSKDKVGGTVKDSTDKTGGAVKDSTDKTGGTVKDTTDTTADAVKDTTDTTGGAVKDTTDTTGGAVKDTTDTTGGAVTDVTGKTGGGNGITGKTGGSLDDTQRGTGRSVAGVMLRDGDSRRPTGVDGISRSTKGMLSVDRISRAKGGGNDLASVIQAPGTALGDSFDSAGASSSGSSNLKLPFDSGTLPVTGAELALILLVGLATSCAGWGIVRLARSREGRQRRGAPEVQTVT